MKSKYTYKEFSTDLDAVLPPLNRTEGTWDGFIELTEYIRKTYTDPIERLERGSFLNRAIQILQNNLDELDVNDLAVRGTEAALISEHLMRGIYMALIQCSVPEVPDVATIIKLADQYRDCSNL